MSFIFYIHSQTVDLPYLQPSKQISHTIDFSCNFFIQMKQPDLYLCNIFIQTYSQIFLLLPIRTAIHTLSYYAFHPRQVIPSLDSQNFLALSHVTLQPIKLVQTTFKTFFCYTAGTTTGDTERKCAVLVYTVCFDLFIVDVSWRERERNTAKKQKIKTKTHFFSV